MTALAPLTLTFYDPETVDPCGEYYCNFMQLKQFKLAMGLASAKLNVNQAALSELIVEVFHGQFTIDWLEHHTSQTDRMRVLSAIIQRGNLLMARNDQDDEEEVPEEGEDEPDDDWIVKMEVLLVKKLGWSLKDIDETDIESLMPFIAKFTKKKKVFIDQLDI